MPIYIVRIELEVALCELAGGHGPRCSTPTAGQRDLAAEVEEIAALPREEIEWHVPSVGGGQ